MSEFESRFFSRLGKSIYEHPVVFLSFVLLIVAGFLSQLPKIQSNNSLESFLGDHDPAVQRFDQFRSIFGHDEIMMVGFSDEKVLTAEKLKLIKQIHEELEASVPHLSQLDSILNTRYIYGNEDELIVEDLVEVLPRDENDIEILKNKIESSALYKGLVIDESGKLTTLTLRLRGEYRDPETGEFKAISDVQLQEVLYTTQQVVDPYKEHFEAVFYAGTPAVTVVISAAMQQDIRVFTISSIAIIGVILFLLFHRISGVIIPLVVVVLSAAVTFSLFPIFSQYFQMPSSILPSFILAVGVGDSVHFLTHFYRKFDESGDKEQAIIYAFERTGLAMFLTSITTMAGLLSFASAELVPVANIGLFAAGGVFAAFVLTITLIPCLVRLLPIRRIKGSGGALHLPFFDKFLVALVDLIVKRAGFIVFAFAVLITLCIYLATNIKFAHDPLSWFPEDTEIRRSTSTMDSSMGGTMPLEIMVTVEEGDKIIQEPAFLRAMEKAQRKMDEYDDGVISTGKVLSSVDMIKETHQALNGNDSSFYQIPKTKEIVGSEMFLLELSGADDLYRLVDREFDHARTTVIIPWLETSLYKQITEEATVIYQQALAAEGFQDSAHVSVTGMIPIMGNTLVGVMNSTARSYIFALAIVSVMMVLLLRNLKFGLISMLPNILPIVLILGLMVTRGAQLDLFTMMIGSIALGLAVDDTVHFMHTFMGFHKQMGKTKDAILATLQTTGRAMLTTTIVLSLGFFIYLFSALSNLTNFGLYTGLCILLALIADFVFAPALLVLLNRDENDS